MKRTGSINRTVPIRLAGAAAALMLLASCGAGKPAADGGGDSAVDAAGIFSFVSSAPDSLVPGKQQLAYDEDAQIFSPLTRVNGKGEIEYVQAESVTSDDSITWTIKLRDGWTFQNGEPVTAESYVKAWNYTAYGPNAWANAGQLAAIVGFADVNGAKPTSETMSGLKVVDKNTFTVQLTSPNSQFPIQLTQSITGLFPMPEAAYKDMKAYEAQPIGNGPYELTGKWSPDETISVRAYKDFKGTKPKNGGIDFKPYANAETGYTDVQADNTDLILVPASKFTTATADFPDGKLHSFDSMGVRFLNFPPNDPNYSDVRIRKAISMSINREELVKVILGGHGKPGSSLTPPVMPGSPDGICDYCTFDPAKAKALLAEAGGWKGGDMKLWFGGGIGNDKMVTAVANQIRQNLGIPSVDARPTIDFAEFLQAQKDHTINGPAYNQWGALYPSMQSTLLDVYSANGVGNTYLKYTNPQAEQLFKDAAAATDQKKAQDLFVQAQKVILNDVPTVPLINAVYLFATSDKVTNIVAYNGIVQLDQVEVKGN